MTNKQQMSELKAKFQLLFPIFNRTIEPSPSRSGSILCCGWCGAGSLCSQSYHCLRWHFPSPPCSALWVTTMQCTVRNVKIVSILSWSLSPDLTVGVSPSRPGSAQWKISECARVTAEEECEGDSICLEITSQKNPEDDTFIASDSDSCLQT